MHMGGRRNLHDRYISKQVGMAEILDDRQQPPAKQPYRMRSTGELHMQYMDAYVDITGKVQDTFPTFPKVIQLHLSPPKAALRKKKGQQVHLDNSQASVPTPWVHPVLVLLNSTRTFP